MADLLQRFSRVLARDEVYLANHSLGRPLDQVEDDVREGLSLWYERLDEAWDSWLDEFDRFSGNVRRLLGLGPSWGIAPKASCGQGLRAVLSALGDGITVVASTMEFDSLDFILRAYEKRGKLKMRWIKPTREEQGVPIFEIGKYREALIGADLVILSRVFFTTGQVLDGADEFVSQARREGVKTLMDVYHAAGVLPLTVDSDFCVGGCYKYLRGGPGACWLGIHPSILADPKLKTLDTGWFAKKDTFSYIRGSELEYEDGERGWWESTPAVLPLYQARSGLEFTLEMGVENLRKTMLERLAMLRSTIHGCFNPQRPEDWGQFALVPSPQAHSISKALQEEHQVVTDARNGFIRFGPDILNTQSDFERAAEALARL